MPFDGSGNFSRVHDWTTDRDNGIKIQASRMDDEFDDMAAAFNVVFFRNGLVPMTGDLAMGSNDIKGIASGTALAPSIQFASDPNSGLYLNAVGEPAITANGVQRLRATSTGVQVTGVLGASGAATVGGTLGVTGATTLSNTLDVTGAATLGSTLGVTGAATLSSTLTVTGNVTVGTAKVAFGSTTRQMVDLFGSAYGVGVQSNTAYIRSGNRFSVFVGGVHDSTENTPGTGGTVLFTANSTEIKYLTNTIWHSGNDGAGSGLDADTLDGQQGAYYLPAASYTAADVLAKLITVDGPGSGLNADLLDGSQAAAFALLSGATFTGTVMLNNGAVVGRTGAEPYIQFNYDGTGVAQIRGVLGGGVKLTDTTGVTNWLAFNSTGVGSFSASGLTVAGNTVWHAGNDGAGSGLDADLLDGQQGSAYALLSGADFTGNITTAGTIQVTSGAGFNIGSVGGRPRIEYNTVNAQFRLLDTAGAVEDLLAATGRFTGLTVNGNTVWHTGNDGAGSGLDADTLDALQATAFVRVDGTNQVTADIVRSGGGDFLYNSQASRNGAVSDGTAAPSGGADGDIYFQYS